MNLRNIKTHEIKTGDVLCAPDQSKPSRLIDVAIDPPASGVRPLSHMEEVTILCGTRHCPARVRLLAGENQPIITAQLEFQTDQISFPGQRFVIRRPALSETVTGGQVLDPEARLVRRQKDRHANVLLAAANQDPLSIAEAISTRDDGHLDLSLLNRLARVIVDDWSSVLKSDFALTEDGCAFSRTRIESLKAQLIETTNAFHLKRPIRPHAPSPVSTGIFKGVPSEILAHAVWALLDDKILEARLDGIASVGHDPNENLSDLQRNAYEQTVERLRQTALMPELSFGSNISHQDCADLLELMVWNGHAVRLYNHSLKQSLVLHAETIDDAAAVLKKAFPGEQPFKTGESRTVLSTNRKTIVPLLEHLDACGITRRDGNSRVIKATRLPE